MRIQIEATDKICTVDRVECRLWNGVTEDGVHCFLLVHRIGVHVDENSEQFERQLKEMYHPKSMLVAESK